MIKQKNKIDHLDYFGSWYLTEVTHSMACTKCGSEVTEDAGFDEDPTEFLEERYRNGWRTTNKNCYCPDCRKKHLSK